MAEIRCPNCGRENPDSLDVCQFCQTRLKPESVLRIGEKPTKKNTGELEPILPDWLKEMRQQSKASADEQAAQAAAQPKVQKIEPPDLLAGLASQSGGEENDIPDWLAGINPTAKPNPSPTPEPDTDFFARFNQGESKPEPAAEPSQADAPLSMGRVGDQPPVEKDELSEWFSQESGQPEQTFEFDPNAQTSGDAGWSETATPTLTPPEKSPRKEDEDLSWLYNLEAAAKQTGDLQSPKENKDWTADFEMPSTPAQGSGSQQDLSWLDNLGGIEESSQPAPERSAAPQNDLSWLNQFSGTSEPAQPSQPADLPPASQQDLSWLNNLGASAEPEPASPSLEAAPDQPVLPQPFASEEELTWLGQLGKSPETSQPAAQEDLSWLNQLGGEPDPSSALPFAEAQSGMDDISSRQTAPLNQSVQENDEPDWLKSAIERPSMPAPGDLSMDWFQSAGQPLDKKPLPSTPQAAPFASEAFSTPSESSQLPNQDVDSLFSQQMPDWLSQPAPETSEAGSQQTSMLPSEGDESLAPVDLPSWVQAMRPVEAVISEATTNVEDQPVEMQGPLAGLHGVLPISAIGSAKRPRAVSLKLHVSDEQQASAALLEQILGSETSPRSFSSSSLVVSQQWLRWALAGLFLIVLSAIIFLRSQTIPVSASLPAELGSIANVVMSIPSGARVLIVIDYEPALAGEMEAIGGPLLDQIVLLSQPNLSFISTSPNGPALVERLVSKTGINQADSPYLNLGYLPGGSAGVLGFLEAPGQIVPAADVQAFSEYSVLVVLSDHAESGRIWVEQLQTLRGNQADPALANQPFLMVASAQAGPLLQPYVSSRQISGMISGLSDAARYEFVNNSRPGLARSYWDAFGIGLMMSVVLILIGSLWSLFTGVRSRRVDTE